jgi:hypothetical protein
LAYASALERPAPRKTAPPRARARPRGRRAAAFSRRGPPPGARGRGGPRLPALPGQPRKPSVHRRAVLSYGDGIVTTPQQHTAAPPLLQPKPRHQNRSSPHRRPTRHPRPPLPPPPPPPRPPSYPLASPRGSPPLGSRTLTCLSLICLPCIRVPPPRLRPLRLPAWAGPSRFTWQVEEGGSGAKWRTPTSSKSAGGKPRKQPKAARRPVALRGETHRAKQMEGNTRRETGVPSASVFLFPGASLPLLDHSSNDGAVDRVLADALVLVRRSGGSDFRTRRSDALPIAERAARNGGGDILDQPRMTLGLAVATTRKTA